MKTYWDSSALFNALASKAVFDRLGRDEHVTRSHGYAEVFSHLSGRGLPMKDGSRQRVTPADAAKMVSSLASKLSVRDLTSRETLAAIKLADKRGVQGARIHDLLHVRAAALAGADLVLTRDRGFSSLGENIRAEWP
jgi:predicted nucleic acid-binding protein